MVAGGRRARGRRAEERAMPVASRSVVRGSIPVGSMARSRFGRRGLEWVVVVVIVVSILPPTRVLEEAGVPEGWAGRRGEADSRSRNGGSSIDGSWSVEELEEMEEKEEREGRALMQSSHINRPQHWRCLCALRRGAGCFSSRYTGVELVERRLAQVQHDCISIAMITRLLRSVYSKGNACIFGRCQSR